MLKNIKIISLILLCFLFAPSHSAFGQPVDAPPLPPLQPFDVTALYSVSWGGIDVGNLALNAHETEDVYSLQAIVKTKGLARLFTKHESTNTVEGIKRDDEYLPKRFETRFKLRKNTRHIILTYNDDGQLIEEYNVPPEKRWKRPEVPMELKKEVLDVLSLLFAQRPRIYEAIEKNQPDFSLRAYDGRRLADINIHVKGAKQVSWKNQPTNVIAFTLSRTPIAGHKQSELDEFENNKDPDIEFYLSNDGKLTPLKIVIDTEAGTFHANYVAPCKTMPACLKKL